MKIFILTTTLFVALLFLVSLPIITVGLPKIQWPKPSELAEGCHHPKGSGRLRDSKFGWACTSVADPKVPPSPAGLPKLPDLPRLADLPGLPSLPTLQDLHHLPNLPPLPPLPRLPPLPDLPDLPRLPDLPPLPGLPSLPSLPGLPPLPPFQSVVLSQSVEMEQCLTKDGSKIAEKCFKQIFSSWGEKDFALDKECCEIAVTMKNKCNSQVHMLFKSRFFAPLLHYSCHIKHIKT